MLDKIQDIAINKISRIQNEAQVKQYLVAPILDWLGYDFHNMDHIVPEYIADFATKKGEKIDYCILHKNRPVILIECKSLTEKNSKVKEQLFRYYSSIQNTEGRSPFLFGIVTNGIEWDFYGNFNSSTILDDLPFFSFNLLKYTKDDEEKLKWFVQGFDPEDLFDFANEAIICKNIEESLKAQFTNPNQLFLKSLDLNIELRGKKVEKYKAYVVKTINSIIDTRIQDKLSNILEQEKKESSKKLEEIEENAKIYTTETELELFKMIQTLTNDKGLTYVDTERTFFIKQGSKTICKYNDATSKLWTTNTGWVTIESIKDVKKIWK